MRVLVTTDGSDFANRAAIRSLGLLHPNADVTVLHVVPSPIAATGAPTGLGLETVPILDDEATDDLLRAGAAEAEALAAQLGAKVRSRVEQGDPGRVICEVAAEYASELVVVGSHGSGILKRLLIGSTSKYVLHHAPCPVLVVRAAPHERG